MVVGAEKRSTRPANRGLKKKQVPRASFALRYQSRSLARSVAASSCRAAGRARTGEEEEERRLGAEGNRTRKKRSGESEREQANEQTHHRQPRAKDTALTSPAPCVDCCRMKGKRALALDT